MTYLLAGLFIFGLVVVGVMLGVWAAGKLGYRKPPARKMWWWVAVYSVMAGGAIALYQLAR